MTKIGEAIEIRRILAANKDMDFVKRIHNPEAFPKLYDNPGGLLGKPSTHSMAAEVDRNGDWFVYPTVVNDPLTQGLKRLGHTQAKYHAESSGERIPFGKDGDKAIWFSKQYKRVWDKF